MVSHVYYFHGTLSLTTACHRVHIAQMKVVGKLQTISFIRDSCTIGIDRRLDDAAPQSAMYPQCKMVPQVVKVNGRTGIAQSHFSTPFTNHCETSTDCEPSRPSRTVRPLKDIALSLVSLWRRYSKWKNETTLKCDIRSD